MITLHGKHTTRGLEETWRLAARLAGELREDAVLALHGDLGSGKTSFVQGLALALGIRRPVTSPTFTIVNEYQGDRRLNHIDLYRLSGPDEALALGFEDYVANMGITAIEWAERAADLLPSDTIHVYFSATDAPDERVITVKGADPEGSSYR